MDRFEETDLKRDKQRFENKRVEVRRKTVAKFMKDSRERKSVVGGSPGFN